MMSNQNNFNDTFEDYLHEIVMDEIKVEMETFIKENDQLIERFSHAQGGNFQDNLQG